MSVQCWILTPNCVAALASILPDCMEYCAKLEFDERNLTIFIFMSYECSDRHKHISRDILGHVTKHRPVGVDFESAVEYVRMWISITCYNVNS